MNQIDDETLRLFARLVNPGISSGTLRGFVTETSEVESCRRVSSVRAEVDAISRFVGEGVSLPRRMSYITWDGLAAVGLALRVDGSWKVAARRFGVSYRVRLPFDDAEFFGRFLRSWLNWGGQVPLPDGVELRMKVLGSA